MKGAKNRFEKYMADGVGEARSKNSRVEGGGGGGQACQRCCSDNGPRQN